MGRRSGEMRKGRRGLVIGGMVIGLLMGCNNGIAELEKKNKFLGSVVNLGNEFLNVFTSFGDIISGETLGFKADSSKKEDVGKYFKNIETSLTTTKTTLEKIVGDMEKEGNPNASAVKTKVDELIKNKLNNIIEGAKTVSGAIGNDSNPIGNMANTNAGNIGTGIDNLVKGIKGIVDVVLKEKGDPEAGDDNKADTLVARTGGNTTVEEARKLFDAANSGTDSQTKKSAADAAKAVAAVTGTDILKSIVAASGNAVKIAKNEVNTVKRDAAIAGGIALRAMAKDGKFAGPSNSASVDANKIVAGAATSAVIKSLDTLTIAIKKTIDEGLKSVKQAMNINANDNPVTSESGTTTK